MRCMILLKQNVLAFSRNYITQFSSKVQGDQRILQVGRKLRTSLEELFDQGRLGHVVRPQHSGLGPNGF